MLGLLLVRAFWFRLGVPGRVAPLLPMALEPVQILLARGYGAVPPLGRAADTVVVRDDRELARCRIVANQGFDQIVGRFLGNGKTDVNALVFLLRGSARRRMRGIEDYGNRSRVVTVRCPQQAEK